MTDTIKLHNNITIHKINEPKFNEVLVNMKISMPLQSYQNTVASLLVRMMGDRTNALPTKLAVRENLDTMYGTKTSSHTYTLGTQQVLDISIKSIHSKFVEEDLQKMQLELLKEMVYSPLLNEQTLAEAKVNLKHHHARIKESTSSYAMQQAFMHAAPGTLLEVNSMGLVSDVDKVTLEEVKKLHDLVINDFTKDIILVGEVSNVLDFEMFEEGFSQERVNPLYAS
jgi:predicted Zn-dependent peptidase